MVLGIHCTGRNRFFFFLTTIRIVTIVTDKKTGDNLMFLGINTLEKSLFELSHAAISE